MSAAVEDQPPRKSQGIRMKPAQAVRDRFNVDHKIYSLSARVVGEYAE